MIVKKKVSSATNTCGIPAKPATSNAVKPSSAGSIAEQCAKDGTCAKKKSVKNCSNPAPVQRRVESVATLRGGRKHSSVRDAEAHIRSAIDILCSTNSTQECKETVANLAVILMDMQNIK